MANIPQVQKILIVRTDRIGDVVLSLPMVAALRSTNSAFSVSMLLRSYTRELVEEHPGLKDILLYDRDSVLKPFGAMLSELRRCAFDVVIVTYPTFRLALLMFLSRIPVRIGTGYRWYSPLFNRRVYEHRKTAEKHEAEYNLSLLQPLGFKQGGTPRPNLAVSPGAQAGADEVLRLVGLRDGERFVILHPGSGGSARDWNPGNFGALAMLLSQEMRVLISGGPGEEDLVAEVVMKSNGKAIPLPVVPSLRTLAALLFKASLFVSNSTGPLHIAAAVGTPVVGFYPPIVQCSSTRWGPLTDRKLIFEPDRNRCPRCKGGPCEGTECMDLIKVEDVHVAIHEMMERSGYRSLAYRKAR